MSVGYLLPRCRLEKIDPVNSVLYSRSIIFAVYATLLKTVRTVKVRNVGTLIAPGNTPTRSIVLVYRIQGVEGTSYK